MSTINLASKFATKLDNLFTRQSYFAPWRGKDYDFTGVNAITVWDLVAGELNDYDSTASANRFGTPSEVEDHATTYQLRRKRSFSKVFDATHVQDQMMVKKGAAYLQQMWMERYIPENDKYTGNVWANGAGLGVIGAALTKSTVAEAILTGMAALDDAFVPSENRVIIVRSDVAVKTKLAEELRYSENWVDKTIVKGKITEISGAPVISVPKSHLPDGVAFIIKYKNATVDPEKMKMLRANDNAPGYAGVLMEGLVRYDSFVLANKADGIYVYAETGKMSAIPTITASGDSVTIAASGADTIKYTTDGSNPKSSETAKTYTGAVSITADTKIRAYTETAGLVNSAIASLDVAYSA